MPKHFKVLNIQTSRHTVYTENGWEIAQNLKKLKPILKLIGECDEAGNVLENIAAKNFISKPPEDIKPEISKTNINEGQGNTGPGTDKGGPVEEKPQGAKRGPKPKTA